MKYQDAFIKTEKSQKWTASDAISVLLKAGFVAQNAAGLYTFLPLGFKVFQNIKKIIRKELDVVGVLELCLPVLQPVSVWKKSKRFDEVGEELWKIKNRFGEEFVLSMTAEELIIDTIKNQIKSYKDLPCILNQFQTKIRDEARPRGGLIRLREFVMQDAYSFDRSKEDMDKSHDKILSAYKRIFKKLNVPIQIVKADTGAMGGNASYEVMVENDLGEDTIIKCDNCGYAANLETAESAVSSLKTLKADSGKKTEEVKTPGMKSAVEVSEFLRVDLSDIVKILIYNVDGKLVFVLTRGDLEVNEKKLQNALKAKSLKLASEPELDKAGIIPGFASPIGKRDFKVVGDFSLKLGSGYVAGANRRDYHLKNVTLKMLNVGIWADLIRVKAGDSCIKCGKALKLKKAIELAHTFKLGTKYSEALDVSFVDDKGKKEKIFMGSYGIGLDRLLGVCAILNLDRDGIIWPPIIAPFKIYLLNVDAKDETVAKAEQIHKILKEKYEIIFDDRDTSAGVKFADADLLGAPIRITISQRTMAKDSAEIKYRNTKETELIKFQNLEEYLEKFFSKN